MIVILEAARRTGISRLCDRVGRDRLVPLERACSGSTACGSKRTFFKHGARYVKLQVQG